MEHTARLTRDGLVFSPSLVRILLDEDMQLPGLARLGGVPFLERNNETVCLVYLISLFFKNPGPNLK